MTAGEVEKLVQAAYWGFTKRPSDGNDHRQVQQHIGTSELQRHLLAIQTPTVEDAARAGNDILQIKSIGDRPQLKYQTSKQRSFRPQSSRECATRSGTDAAAVD